MDHHARAIELRAIDELKPYSGNARTHSEKQIRQIAKSIERFKFLNPILIDDEGTIIAGHGRVLALKSLGHKKVPCLRVSHLTAAEKRAYILADNKLAENAGWNKEILAVELQSLIDLDIDIELTGFDAPEVDALLVEADAAAPSGETSPEDNIPCSLAASPVTRVGDLWQLGRHLLLCGDARDLESYQRLFRDDRAAMVFTDPPYNVPIAGNVSGLGRVRHREFVCASGEMSKEAFTEFLRTAFQRASGVCRNGAIAYICSDWRHLDEMSAAGQASFAELKNLCVWVKTNGGMGTFYRSKHELIFVWKIGTSPHINTFGLGGKGRYRTNVWTYAGVNAFKSDRMDELASHPTVKPVALVADAIRDVSNRGDIVVDPFAGSGTTLIAAQQIGRVARLIELDPTYCDVIIRRFERLTGAQAALAHNGETFEHAGLTRNAVWTSPKPSTAATER